MIDSPDHKASGVRAGGLLIALHDHGGVKMGDVAADQAERDVRDGRCDA